MNNEELIKEVIEYSKIYAEKQGFKNEGLKWL